MVVVILGSDDPEMQMIETIARQIVVTCIHALGQDGRRVHPGNAYQAVGLSEVLPADSTVLAVECDGPAIPTTAIRIDHHRPGDPGYGRPPAEFLPASSLGQVISYMSCESAATADWQRIVRVESPPPRHGEYQFAQERNCWIVYSPVCGWRVVPSDFVLAAAADHCLSAAYRGQCPGVHPDNLMWWRVATRAVFQQRPVQAVLEDVEAARRALRTAPRIDLGGELVADLRGQEIPELPDAAAREGIAFIATPRVRPGERRKIVLQCAGWRALDAWPQWAEAHGIVDLYGGDPQRGFAGGYLEDQPGVATPRGKQ